MNKRKFCLSVIILLSLAASTFAYGEANIPPLKKLMVFYSPGCKRCMEIKNTVLPEIEKKFEGQIQIEYRDTDDIENYKLLLGLEKNYGMKINNTPPVFYFEGKFLEGRDPIKELLINLITQSTKVAHLKTHNLPAIDLVQRFKEFEPFTVVSAGLVDGVNPCAFTVIVFFISFLALQGYAKRQLIFIGITFILAVFLTYFLIGIGLFGFLYSLGGFWLVARIFNIGIGVFCIILGILAVYDFFKFKQSGKTEGLTLQLPKAVKNQIHAIIGLHYRKDAADKPSSCAQGLGKREEERKNKSIFRLSLSTFVTGFLVSILEAVCTGQLYLPTITFVLKTSHFKLQALGYLLLYNLMFTVPLFVIFILALFGTTSRDFSRFLKKHLLTLKLLMAVLFFSLGIFLIWKG